MMPSLPENSFARLTLLPGEFSTRTSRSGIGSPTRTGAGRVVWKARRGRAEAGRRADRKGRREKVRRDIFLAGVAGVVGLRCGSFVFAMRRINVRVVKLGAGSLVRSTRYVGAGRIWG